MPWQRSCPTLQIGVCPPHSRCLIPFARPLKAIKLSFAPSLTPLVPFPLPSSSVRPSKCKTFHYANQTPTRFLPPGWSLGSSNSQWNPQKSSARVSLEKFQMKFLCSFPSTPDSECVNFVSRRFRTRRCDL